MGLFQRLFSRAPKPRVAESAPQVLATAEEYRRNGQLAEAIDALEKGAVTNPGYVGVHVSLGRVYLQADRLEDAARAYQSALKLDRGNLVAIRQLADVYLRQGEKIEAIKKLKLYRGLQPGDRDVNEIIERLDLELNPRPRPAVAEPAPGATVPERTTSPVNAPLPAAAPGFVAAASLEAAKPPDTKPIQPPPATQTPAPPPAEAAPFGMSDEPVLRTTGEGPTMAMSMLELLVPLQQLERERAQRIAESRASDEARSAESIVSEPPLAGGPLTDAGERPKSESDLGGRAPSEEAAGAEAFAPQDIFESHGARAPIDAQGSAPEPPAPPITETLADLYRAQGYLADAREGYRSLAEAEDDPRRRQELVSKAEAVPGTRLETPEARLRGWLSRFPNRAAPGIADMGEVLRDLVARNDGVHAVALTDFEGLPVVASGAGSDSPEMEVLVAELTAFWKGVRRIDEEIGSGTLDAFCLEATGGSAVMSAVSSDYALILHVAPGAPIGRIRYEAARTAWLLKPALG